MKYEVVTTTGVEYIELEDSDSASELQSRDNVISVQRIGASDKAVGKFRVLVVEDDVDIYDLIAYNLRSIAEVLHCQYGDEVLGFVDKYKPDLLMLDLGLPNRSGIDVLKDLRQNPETATLPVVIVSGRGDRFAVNAVRDLGVLDFIVKPFSPNDLKTRVRKALPKMGLPELQDILVSLKVSENNFFKSVPATRLFKVFPINHNSRTLAVVLPKGVSPWEVTVPGYSKGFMVLEKTNSGWVAIDFNAQELQSAA